MFEGQRVYYNVVKPHMALGGKTPAEEAGIDLNLGDKKWKELIERSVKNNKPTIIIYSPSNLH